MPEVASMPGTATVQDVAGVPDASADEAFVVATGSDNSETVTLIGGNLQILNEEGENLQVTVESHVHADLRSWNEEISSVFDLPNSEVKKTKRASNKRITNHRLLTSDEIYQQKIAEKEKREQKEKEKEERRIQRLLKAEKKENVKKNGRKRKATTTALA
jgi:hypothetical protein